VASISFSFLDFGDGTFCEDGNDGKGFIARCAALTVIKDTGSSASQLEILESAPERVCAEQTLRKCRKCPMMRVGSDSFRS
jgi:hypothetical protein